jgi:hypothetical protein
MAGSRPLATTGQMMKNARDLSILDPIRVETSGIDFFPPAGIK